jgi:hypothetical protein
VSAASANRKGGLAPAPVSGTGRYLVVTQTFSTTTGSCLCVSRAGSFRDRPADFEEEIGREIRAVLPDNGIQVFVDPEVLEVGDVFEGLEYLAVEVQAEVNKSLSAILEGEQQPLLPGVLGFPYEMHGLLLQRRYGHQRLFGASQFPVPCQLVTVVKRPLQHERDYPLGKSAFDKPEVGQREHAGLSRILGVEVGTLVVLVVHRDDDSEETA